MTNTNSKNLTNCNYCNSCYSCDYCNYCNSCDSCDYCNYCNSCDSCNSCYSCNSCNSCDSCNSCYSCYSCDYCNYCDYCDYSFGLRMSERMLFCLGEGKYETKGIGYQKNYHIFNVQVTKEVYEKAISGKVEFELPIAKWIDKDQMTEDEKKNNTSWKETGGYLKTLSYQDAWKEGWSNASQEFKDWVLGLPNFDKEIFKGITGIELENSLSGQEVEVKLNGVTYKAIIK